MHLKMVEKTDCLSKDCCTTHTNNSSLHNKLASGNDGKERNFLAHQATALKPGNTRETQELKTDPRSVLS